MEGLFQDLLEHKKSADLTIRAKYHQREDGRIKQTSKYIRIILYSNTLVNQLYQPINALPFDRYTGAAR